MMSKIILPRGLGSVRLRLCPWCRGDSQGLIERYSKPDKGGPQVFQVLCKGCKARGPERESQESSARAWNAYGDGITNGNGSNGNL